MPQLVDIHGIPMDLEQVSDFRIVPRECLMYPAYEEIQEAKTSIFAKYTGQDKKKFRFIGLVPFGIILENREKPHIGDYKVESFAEAAGQNFLAGLGDVVVNAGNLIADTLKIDTSINTKYRILTVGRRVVELRLREIPAKVRFLSGKVSDVYKNDPIYPFLGEPIAPTVNRAKTLMVKCGRDTFAFFGGGIDLTDQQIDATYHSLLDSYNQIQRLKDEKKALEKARPLIQFPNIQLPKISIPFLGINIGGNQEPEKAEAEKDSVMTASESDHHDA